MKILILLSLLVTLSCTKSSNQNSSAKTISSDKATLLFFINPDGRPCQIQDEILKSIESKIVPQVTIQRVLTTNQNDRPYFYQYGIRALPILILVDANGKVVKRFSPGIQSEKLVTSTIENCPCKG